MSQIRDFLSMVAVRNKTVLETVRALKEASITPNEAKQDLFGCEVTLQRALCCLFFMLQQGNEEIKVLLDELSAGRMALDESAEEILRAIDENCESCTKTFLAGVKLPRAGKTWRA